MPKSSLPLFHGAGKGQSLVHVLARSKPASAAEQIFRKLVAEIERKRQELAKWEAYRHRYAQRCSTELEPVRVQLRGKQKDMAFLIDELLSRRGQGQRLQQYERVALKDLLMSLLQQLLVEEHDDALAALHKKHGDAASRRRERAEMEMAKGFLTEVMGMEVDEDHGAANLHELFAHATRKMHAQEEEARQSSAGEEHGSSKTSRDVHERSEPAAGRPSPSLRAAFRKLVSALHPDREPDPQVRVRKNELMQRVNEAYEANDLLTLLSLQLELEQIDAAHLSSMSAEHLEQYNQTLRQQLAQIKAKLKEFRERYWSFTPGTSRSRLSPMMVDRKLTDEIEHMKEALQQLTQDLVKFRDPVQRRARLEEHLDLQVCDEDAMLAEILDIFEEAPPSPTHRRSRGRSRRRR